MRVAVTGGIAEGKSTVMEIIRAMGYGTASSDAMAREVFNDPGVQQVLARLVDVGTESVSPAQLRAAMAASEDVRRAVNRTMHPRIREKMAEADAPFHEVPLLIEACLYGRYDRVWVVTCGPDEQRRRLVGRLGDEAAAEALIASQLPTEVKVAFADRVVDSRASLQEMTDFVRGLVSEEFS